MARLSSVVQEINASQAAAWLEKRYKHQRKVSNAHVRNLARAMFDGTFSGVNTIMFSVLDGEHHLLNGQHTLEAIFKSEKPQTMTVNYYIVDNEAEEAELYRRIDHGRKRSFEDSMRVTDIPGKLNLPPTLIKQIASALRFIKTGFGATALKNNYVSDDDLIEWLPDWTWECRAIHHAIKSSAAERNLIIRMAVFSVALITMRYKPREAALFWEQVARDDKVERFAPAKTLREWLKAAQGQSTAPGKRLRNHEIARGAALAWNMYMQGINLKYIAVDDKWGPIRLIGTPYDGEQGLEYLPLYPSPNAERAEKLTLDGLAEQASQWQEEMREEVSVNG